MNCAEIQPDLEAYALNALDSVTRARVEKHLLRCSACRAHLQQVQQLVGELPFALGNASALQPPGELKRRVMQSVQAQLQADAIKQTIGARAELAPTARRGHWLLNSRTRTLALGAAIVVIFALFVWNMTTSLRMQQAISSEHAALKQVDALRQQQELAVPVLNAVHTEVIALSATALAPNAYGKVLKEPGKPTVVFIAYNLPQPTLSQSYMLWTISKGVIQRAGQFSPNVNGFGMVVFMSERDDPLLKEVFVTQQPESSIFPAAERYLIWKADPNDLNDDFTYDSLFPRPATARPGR